ncbi:hypothetical protein FH972_016786 [Carpinus fangiana]|uniref:Uncharacterized protein n=1 Tax=Carpinus fangiana TaxID=176857 RepID=A0A5N6RIZ8_9ROSI|nr:hypothetical protein FH972_016786 [Carpinus fangiana]
MGKSSVAFISFNSVSEEKPTREKEPLVTKMESEKPAFSTSDLSRELDVAEQIGEAPDSLHLHRNALVYEVVRMVGEDYRLVQFEDCKARLSLLFANRKRNDGLWELIGETKMKLLIDDRQDGGNEAGNGEDGKER